MERLQRRMAKYQCNHEHVHKMNGHPQHHGALVLVNGRCLMLTHNHGPGGVDSSSVRVHGGTGLYTLGGVAPRDVLGSLYRLTLGNPAACEPAMSVTGLDEGEVRGSGVREVAQ